MDPLEPNWEEARTKGMLYVIMTSLYVPHRVWGTSVYVMCDNDVTIGTSCSVGCIVYVVYDNDVIIT